ncbi:MFS general substrate transporter [Trametes coccinea BRFM310]|uniref:MFS general substrate transporter n=1 Tax=Trametes coccinea (strain BRFM310) TaxID=1353009 RepID=A0A1Y2IHB6_TRAC3|nr:MFS general substrate transporter [Trametes coccinea BRFM310]
MFSDNRGTLSDNSRSDLVEKPADGSQLSLEHTFAAPPASADPPSGPEDGGKWPWLTVAGAWMIQFCTFGYLNAFGVYQDFYTSTLLPDASPSDISWIGSIQLFLMYALAVFVGRAFDSGYFHHVQIAGSLLLVLSIFCLSIVPATPSPALYAKTFLAQGLGTGLAVGLLFLPSLSIVSHRFPRTRPRRAALAMGITVSGASAGGVVWPVLLNRMFDEGGFGFRDGVRVCGGIVAGLLVLANGLMRTGGAAGRRRAVFTRGGFLRIVRDGAYVWSIAGAFCTNLGLFVPFFYLQIFASDHGVSPVLTTYILAVLNAGSTLGRVLPVALAGRVGVYAMLIPAIAASAGFVYALLGVRGGAGVGVVAALFGLSSGAYVSLIPPLLGMLCTDLGELGLRMGLAFSLVGTSMLVGTPVFGALLDVGGGEGTERVWWRAVVFAGKGVPASFEEKLKV